MRVTIEGEKFLFDGVPTYRGRSFEGADIEGLLFNTRMVQAIFDDENPESRGQWAYPDTGKWDPDRNVQEFIAALPIYRSHGVTAVTLNLQGGMPVVGTERKQPWLNSAFTPDGELKPAYLARLERALRACDAAGLAVILGYFYFGQDENMTDEATIRRGTENATRWLLEKGFENILVEVNNECDVPLYEHEILRPGRVTELVELVRSIEVGGRRLLASTSFTGGAYHKLERGIPTDKTLAACDYALVHTNDLDPDGVRQVLQNLRNSTAFKARPMPVVINEDSTKVENMDAAFPLRAAWGYYDQGKNNYRDGYQSPPVNWGISTPEKERFFGRVGEITEAQL